MVRALNILATKIVFLMRFLLNTLIDLSQMHQFAPGIYDTLVPSEKNCT